MIEEKKPPYSASWFYHMDLEPVLCKSQEEQDALGPEWADSPAAFDVEPKQEEVMEGAMEIASAPRKRGRRKAL